MKLGKNRRLVATHLHPKEFDALKEHLSVIQRPVANYIRMLIRNDLQNNVVQVNEKASHAR